MYARSYEKNDYEQGTPPLPSGYHGVAFEHEEEKECAPPSEPPCIPAGGAPRCEENAPLSFLDRFLPLKRIFPEGKSGFFGSLFSETEDILLIGIFLLLLFSKEGDPLCAVAVLILLISDKF